MKQFAILFCFITVVLLCKGQETCTASVSGDQALRNLSWNCTNGASPPNASGTYNLNLVINGLGNGEELIIDRDYYILGDITINASGSNPTLVVNAGSELKVGGDIINDDNNLRYSVDGDLRVGGSITGKNNHVFSGSGSIYAYEVVLNNGASFGTPAPNLYVYDCNASPAGFCSSSNVSTEPASFDPLPVEIVKFEANKIDNYVLLVWVTAAEINNQHFEIERSSNGENFETLGIVEGNGTSNNPSNYEFLDKNPITGLSFYRLKQVDFNGNTDVWPSISVNSNTAENFDLSIFPNPSDGGFVYITMPNLTDTEYEVYVNDFLGNEVFTDLTFVNQGKSTLVILTLAENLPAGIYLINVSNKHTVYSKKLVVK